MCLCVKIPIHSIENELQHIQGGALKLVPPLLHSYVVEGVPILVPHPVVLFDLRTLKILLLIRLRTLKNSL